MRRQVDTRLFTYPLRTGTRRFGDAYPGGQRVRCVKGEDQTASGLRVEPVGKLRLRAGALVQEWERAPMGGKAVGQARAVLLGLDLDTGQRGPLGLGFDDARCFLVHVEQVVCGAVTGLQAELAHRHPAGGVQIDGASVLDGPSSLLEQLVDVYARLLFWVHLSKTGFQAGSSAACGRAWYRIEGRGPAGATRKDGSRCCRRGGPGRRSAGRRHRPPVRQGRGGRRALLRWSRSPGGRPPRV